MSIDRIIDSLFSSVWYDYSKGYVRATVRDIEHMIVNQGTRSCTELASFMFKVLVFLYGNYGIAPATGWITDEYKKPLLEAIDSWCKEMRIFEYEDE